MKTCWRLVVLTLLWWPTLANAGWLDKVADILKEVSANDNIEESRPAAQLIEAKNGDPRLPKHWQTYWLDEPVFQGRVFLAATGKLDGPVIMLVHGLGQNGLRDWLPVVPALEQHYRIVMVDLPGFALSAPPKAKLSPSHYAELLHFIKPYFSAAAVTVVGHSMGAAVALRYAHQYPNDTHKIGLIDAAGILQRTAFIKHSATGRIPTNPEVVSQGILEYAVGAQDLGNAMIEKMIGLPDPTVWLGKSETAWGIALGAYPNINAAMGLIEEDFAAAAFETPLPVAILWGKNDPIAPLRTGQALVNTLPDSHLTIIDGAKHVPMASHSAAVEQWFLHTLLADKGWGTAANATKHSAQGASQNTPKDFNCEHQAGKVLTGQYRHISLNDCTGIVLQDVIAEKIVLRDSVIEINNSHISATSIAIDASDSVAVVTGSHIAGAVHLNDARLDIAGSQFTADKPFVVNAESRIVASVCRIGQQRYLHGDMVLHQQHY